MTIPRTIGIFRLTRDPELRSTPSGKTVTTLGLAASNSKKDESGNWQKTETLYAEATLWGNQAETVNNSCRKGDKIYIDGTLYIDRWKDENGNNRTITKMRIHTFEIIEKPHNQPPTPQNNIWGNQPTQNFGSIDQPPF